MRPALPSVVHLITCLFVLLVSGFRIPQGTERSAGHALFKTFYRASLYLFIHHFSAPSAATEIFRLIRKYSETNPSLSEILLSKP